MAKRRIDYFASYPNVSEALLILQSFKLLLNSVFRRVTEEKGNEEGEGQKNLKVKKKNSRFLSFFHKLGVKKKPRIFYALFLFPFSPLQTSYE